MYGETPVVGNEGYLINKVWLSQRHCELTYVVSNRVGGYWAYSQGAEGSFAWKDQGSDFLSTFTPGPGYWQGIGI